MSRGEHTCDHEGQSLQGLYRDRENGWIFGVCAGLAEYLGFRTGMMRILAVVSLFLFFWPTALAYLAAAMLIRTKPLTWSGRCREYEFWRRHSSHDEWRHS
jgi:phage shock protein C